MGAGVFVDGDILSAAVIMTASAAMRTLLLRRGFSLLPLLVSSLLLLVVLTSSAISEGEKLLQGDDGPLLRGEFDVSDVVYSSCAPRVEGDDNDGGDGRRREFPEANARRRG